MLFRVSSVTDSRRASLVDHLSAVVDVVALGLNRRTDVLGLHPCEPRQQTALPLLDRQHRCALPNPKRCTLIELSTLASEWIFVFGLLLGLLLGLVRWRTGSTTLTILLHTLWNLKDWIETEFVMG
jgi:hypothetical protein